MGLGSDVNLAGILGDAGADPEVLMEATVGYWKEVPLPTWGRGLGLSLIHI